MCIYDGFSLPGIPLVDPPTVSSTTSDSITVSWTAHQPPPTGYMLNLVCVVICYAGPLSTQIITTAMSGSTSETFSSIPPGSECNITFTAQYGTVSGIEFMLAATTLLASELTLVSTCFVLLYHGLYLLFLVHVIFNENRTISSTHWF